MAIEKTQIIKLCFRFGAVFSVLALFLPATYNASTSRDGFASGLFSGAFYGAEELLILSLFPPVGVTLIILLICQITLAFKRSITYESVWKYIVGFFVLLSLMLIITIGDEAISNIKNHGYDTYGNKLLIGYYFYSIGT